MIFLFIMDAHGVILILDQDFIDIISYQFVFRIYEI